MSYYRPEGTFGPVCDPKEITTVVKTVVLPKSESQWKKSTLIPDTPPNPENFPIPTALYAEEREVDGILEYRIVYDRPDLFKINGVEYNGTDNVYPGIDWSGKIKSENQPVTNKSFVMTPEYCADFAPDQYPQPQVYNGLTYYYRARSYPVTFQVDHPAWFEELNKYAIFINPKVCNYEGKTGRFAPRFSCNINFPVTGTYLFRVCADDSCEVWIDRDDDLEIPGTQLYNSAETGAAFSSAQMLQKTFTISAGVHKVLFIIYNIGAQYFAGDGRKWEVNPTGIACRIFQSGSYSSTSVTGIPLSIALETNTENMVVWNNGSKIPGATVYDTTNAITAFSRANSDTEYTVPFSNAKGLAGTLKVSPQAQITYDVSNNEVVTIITKWYIDTITSYGSGYAVDESFTVSYTGPVGGSVSVKIRIDRTRSTSSETTELWSTAKNAAMYDISTTPFT